MGETFVYSNCIGAFLFSESYELVEKALFSDVVAANIRLENNEWTAEEKKLCSKSELFLGFKKEKNGIKLTNDLRKLEAVEKQLKQYETQINEVIFKLAKSKIKASVGEDELIIQAISSIKELDKSVSMLAKRLREWYGLRNPELALIPDNSRFIKEVLDNKATSEMGVELSDTDNNEIQELAEIATQLLQLRAKHEKYVEAKMKKVCPNLLMITGVLIGAKILAGAGSLRRLAILPASTVQLLGAEKAMFNFLRKKSKKMPRFGILHEHELIASAKEREKGKMARLLADKISIAARVDYFKGEFVGDKLLAEINRKRK